MFSSRAIILKVTVASNLKLDMDVPQRTILPWGMEVMAMLGHVSESEFELLLTHIESILESAEKSDSNMASWFAMAFAARESVAPSLIHYWLVVEFGEKTDPVRNSQRCRVFSSWPSFPARSSPAGCCCTTSLEILMSASMSLTKSSLTMA